LTVERVITVDPGFDRDEYDRWLEQARYTLRSAQRDLDACDYAWSSFKSQQAGEYAAKALLRGYGRLAAGHSILRLLEEMRSGGVAVDDVTLSRGKLLDRHYIAPRYPDAYPGGSPFEFYDEETARQALEAARSLLDWLGKMGEHQ
jgi:HEPN domain-containing protein